jgi:hypothetical protein
MRMRKVCRVESPEVRICQNSEGERREILTYWELEHDSGKMGQGEAEHSKTEEGEGGDGGEIEDSAAETMNDGEGWT